jgi:ABC-2 type transport system ATP-binding protein
MAIVTRGLTKRYGARLAVDGLELQVPHRQVYGFLGPNGSGKTTTLRMLVGLIRPTSGSIEVLGEPYSWHDRKRLAHTGALIETPAFYPYLSGRDNLRVFGATGPAAAHSRPDEVLDAVGLTDRARDKVRTYSLGMRQRLGIAVALLSDPDLLLLDEPANGLDPAGIVAMRELLRYLTGQGKTVLVSSHILPEVQQLADIVGILDRGRLVRQGPMGELLASGAQVRVRVRPDEVAGAMEVLQALGAPLEPELVSGAPSGRIIVRVPVDQAAAVNRMLAERGIFASGIESTSDLESVFLALTVGSGMDVAEAAGPPAGWGQPGATP